MKRKLIAALLAFVFCAATAVFATIDMVQAWGTTAACSIDSLTGQDLRPLMMLHPELKWTVYVQSPGQNISSDALPSITTEAAVLSFFGEPTRIAFFPIAFGRLPLDGEFDVCALDKDTAFRLFGSVAPGEESIRLKGKPVRVIGVIDADSPLVLMPAAQDEVFDRLVADDRNVLLTLGIEPDPFELDGAELLRLMWLLCALPWVLGAVFVLASLHKQGGGWRIASTVLICALSLGALLALLWCIPVRLLPARWSDFAFYKEQMLLWKARPFRSPDVRDELLTSDILRVALCCTMACIALWIGRMRLRYGK